MRRANRAITNKFAQLAVASIPTSRHFFNLVLDILAKYRFRFYAGKFGEPNDQVFWRDMKKHAQTEHHHRRELVLFLIQIGKRHLVDLVGDCSGKRVMRTSEGIRTTNINNDK